MNFRTDINGLRALAVLGVVIFHFLGDRLPGGFAGVDVFFVISGFLMTCIIFRGLEKNNFSIQCFYAARAKRIVPALTVLCLILLIVGWFVMHPFDFKTAGKHAFGSMSFLSNMVYLRESGYFDEASREKWLLHTWSLSVEWQFYVVYPLLLSLLHRFMGRLQLRCLLVVGLFLSFALCIYASSKWPTSAFYLLPSRAWEMLAGGLAFLYPLKMTRSFKLAAEVLGLLLIMGSYVWITESMVWPGYWAAIPVAGTVLVIAANRSESWVTGNQAFQWIGKTSYSIYLWHWPLVVALNYTGKSTDALWISCAMALSIGLGAASFYGVENRKALLPFIRYIRPLFGPNLGWLYVVTLAIAMGVFFFDGFAFRLNSIYKQVTKDHVMPTRGNGYCFVDFNDDSGTVVSETGLECRLGGASKTARTLLFGDSFAGHYEPFWDAVGKANGIAINAVTTNWCMPISGDSFDGPVSNPAFQQCKMNRKFLQTELARYTTVIFAGMWSNSLRGGYLDQVSATIRNASKTVTTIIVMPAPTHYDTNVLKRYQRSLFYHSHFDLAQFPHTQDADAIRAYAMLRERAKGLSNVLFLERDQLFSPTGSYEKAGNVIPYSLDGMHITLEGSQVAAQTFMRSDLYRQVVLEKLTKP